jgi:hypothetical protein
MCVDALQALSTKWFFHPERPLELLQWAHANGCPWDGLTCNAALSVGSIDGLKWARGNGCPYGDASDDVYYIAALGRLDLLEWYVQGSGCALDQPFLVCVCIFSLDKAHGLDFFRWAHAKGLTPAMIASTQLACEGTIPILEWAHANGWTLSKQCCTDAARLCRLDMLVWLRAHGCLWGPETHEAAVEWSARSGDGSMLRFSVENGCPTSA